MAEVEKHPILNLSEQASGAEQLEVISVSYFAPVLYPHLRRLTWTGSEASLLEREGSKSGVCLRMVS